MPQNTQVLGIAALLLVVAAQNGDILQSHGNRPPYGNPKLSYGNQPVPYKRLPAIDIPKLARGVHRMAGIANSFDNIGQMALNAPSALQLFSAMGQMANQGNNENADGTTIPELIGNNMPDFGKLMQNIGPMLSNLGNSYQSNLEQNQYIDSENGNALF